jgi:hypothetical protein
VNRLSWSWLKIKPSELSTPTAILLIIANLIPLYGVFFLDWDVFPILLLFWMENVVVGIFNVFKMLVASPASGKSWAAKVVMIPFFCFHYGIFTAVHGIFVFIIFGGYLELGANFPEGNVLFQSIKDFQLGWVFLALIFSHAFSYIFNYIGKGEYKQADLKELMEQPYSRVVLLHVTILIGGFLIMQLGSPVFALLVLIFLKTFIDVQAHLREHKKYQTRKETNGRTELQTSRD